jgi:hypothetical protein
MSAGRGDAARVLNDGHGRLAFRGLEALLLEKYLKRGHSNVPFSIPSEQLASKRGAEALCARSNPEVAPPSQWASSLRRYGATRYPLPPASAAAGSSSLPHQVRETGDSIAPRSLSDSRRASLAIRRHQSRARAPRIPDTSSRPTVSATLTQTASSPLPP